MENSQESEGVSYANEKATSLLHASLQEKPVVRARVTIAIVGKHPKDMEKVSEASMKRASTWEAKHYSTCMRTAVTLLIYKFLPKAIQMLIQMSGTRSRTIKDGRRESIPRLT